MAIAGIQRDSHFLSIWINATGKLTERNRICGYCIDRPRSTSPWRGRLRKRDILYKHRVRPSFVNIMDQCMKSDCLFCLRSILGVNNSGLPFIILFHSRTPCAFN